MEGAAGEIEHISSYGVAAADEKLIAVEPAGVVEIERSNLLFGVVAGHA
jgi:hypothetical protein